jgi:hypothetical protein
VAEEHDVAGAEGGGCGALLLLALQDEGGVVDRRIPGALRAVGEDELGDGAIRRRPFGQRATAAEVDVVGMGADRQSPPGNGQVHVEGTGARGSEIAGHRPTRRRVEALFRAA